MGHSDGETGDAADKADAAASAPQSPSPPNPSPKIATQHKVIRLARDLEQPQPDAKISVSESKAATGDEEADAKQVTKDFKAQRERSGREEREHITVHVNINGAQIGGNEAARPATPPPADWPESAFQAADGEPQQLGLLLALVAQHRCRDGIVKDAAKTLGERLAARLKNGDAKRELPPKLQLPKSQSSMLRDYRAESFRDSADRVAGDRLRFVSDADFRAVLTFSWFEIASFWGDDLSSWMVELGGRSHFESRVAVGSAAGVLAQRDFGAVRHALIGPWLRASTTRPLTAIDAALSVAAEDPGVRPAAEALVTSWQKSRSSDEVWVTGALARGFWGRKDPTSAFAGLSALIKMNRADAYDQAVRGFATWFERGIGDVASGARAMVELHSAIKPEDSWEDIYLRGLIFLGVVGEAIESTDDGIKVLQAALSTPESQRAAGRMMLELFRVEKKELRQLKIEVGAESVAGDLFEAAARRIIENDPAWVLLDAMARHATGSEGRMLSNWLRHRRTACARRTPANLAALDAVLARLG